MSEQVVYPDQDADLFKVGILHLCEGLRMSLHGSADGLSAENEHRVASYLERRLTNWRPSTHRRTRVYDEAVRTLVAACLAEYDLAVATRESGS